MSTTLSEKSFKPWYAQGWPWFLIALPAVAVVAGIITLVIAVRTSDGLVIDDYYKEGKAVVQTMNRSTRARELGFSARLNIRSDRIRIELAARDAASLPATLLLTISHPTREGMDQHLKLDGAGAVFETGIAALSAGRWLIQLEDEGRTWRLNGAAYLPNETDVSLRAAES
jgi:hypothetical protein